jgi:hypothetical protein
MTAGGVASKITFEIIMENSEAHDLRAKIITNVLLLFSKAVDTMKIRNFSSFVFTQNICFSLTDKCQIIKLRKKIFQRLETRCQFLLVSIFQKVSFWPRN